MNASTSDSVPTANASDPKEYATRESAEAAVESSTAPEPATRERVRMPRLDLPAMIDGFWEGLTRKEPWLFIKQLPVLRKRHQQVQHHLELSSFDPPDLPQWERAAERLRELTEWLERAVEEAALIKLLAALLTTAAQQPSDEQAAIDVVVLGKELCAALGKEYAEDSECVEQTAEFNVLLPPLVDVCRAFDQAYSDERLKLQSLREALLQAKQPFVRCLMILGHGLLPDMQVDVDLATAQRDLLDQLLEKRAELDVELAKGKRRELVAKVLDKLGFELPKKCAFQAHSDRELNKYHDRLWGEVEAKLLHAAIGYDPLSVVCVGSDPDGLPDGHQSEQRSINAVRQLLERGVSPDAKMLDYARVFYERATPLKLCAVNHDRPECAKLLLRAGATIDQELVIQMARSAARLLVERALEPWSPSNHELFPDAARRFVVQLLLIGKQLAARPGHGPLADLWLEKIMSGAVVRDARA